MIYTVVWTPTAEQDLAAIWLDAVDRAEITSAAYTIDQILRQEPETRGGVAFDTVRTLAVPPLGIDFEIIEADRLVYVLSVWRSEV